MLMLIYFPLITDDGESMDSSSSHLVEYEIPEFGPNIKVNPDDDIDQMNPQVLVDKNGTIYVLWWEEKDDNADIYLAKSVDHGQTFSKPVRVNEDPNNSDQRTPSMAIDTNGSIYVVWMDCRNDVDGQYEGLGRDDADIYFAKSTDGGNSFSKNVRVDDDNTNMSQGRPLIAVDNNDVIYVVWGDCRTNDEPIGIDVDVYFSKSLDGGLSFSENILVNKDKTYAPATIKVDSRGIIYLLLASQNTYDPYWTYLYLVKSYDGGETFEFGATVSDYSGESEICLGDLGYIYAVWIGAENDCFDVFFRNL
jgi:hypothetical protein